LARVFGAADARAPRVAQHQRLAPLGLRLLTRAARSTRDRVLPCTQPSSPTAQFFPSLFGSDDGALKSDKESFTLQFERLKAAVLGKGESPAMKKLTGEGPAGLSEADIADLSLADKFLARRLRLQALKYRDYLVESGKLTDFEKMSVEQAWAKKAEVDAIKDPAFIDHFAAGKMGTESPAFTSLPEWGKEALSQMKSDEAFISAFKKSNPESAKNIEAAIAQATAAQKAGGIMPTCSAPRGASRGDTRPRRCSPACATRDALALTRTRALAAHAARAQTRTRACTRSRARPSTTSSGAGTSRPT
jgi:hypothetical protein